MKKMINKNIITSMKIMERLSIIKGNILTLFGNVEQLQLCISPQRHRRENNHKTRQEKSISEK